MQWVRNDNVGKEKEEERGEEDVSRKIQGAVGEIQVCGCFLRESLE